MVTLFDKFKRNPFMKMKLTMRLTVFNIILFTLFMALIMVSVTFLTKQFLYLKNREAILSREDQIYEQLNTLMPSLDELPPDQRIPLLYNRLQNKNIFDNAQTLLAIFDASGRSSYDQSRDLYYGLLYDRFEVNPDNVTLSLQYISPDPETLRLKMALLYNPSTEEPSTSADLYTGTPSKKNPEQLTALFINLPTTSERSTIKEAKIMGYTIHYSVIRIDMGSDPPIFVTVFLYPSLDRAFIINLNSAMATSAIIGIILLAIFGRFFSRRALKPLVNLSYVAQNITNETLDYRIETNGSDDEIDTLIKSLNRMLQNLEMSFDYQKRFVSDASHELRIPLTIILGYIDLLKTMGTEDPRLLDESISAIEDEALNMRRLVEKLLTLARMENKVLEINPVVLPISRFVNAICSESRGLYPNHFFESDLRYTKTLFADEEVLKHMLRALIENAVKYSPPGSVITIRSAATQTSITLTVSDQGVGIPQDKISEIGNRFYRLQDDRNRNTGGSGLGLSIVSGFIKAHGGKLQIDSAVGVGTDITLLFPKTIYPGIQRKK